MMGGPEPASNDASDASAQREADRLALALEEVGFDVGRALPELGNGTGLGGTPIVHLGHTSVDVASRLANVLFEAARRGVHADR